MSSLSSRPKTETYELQQLVTAAWSGRLRIPHFQRNFRWERQDVIRLFDSIIHGYPVGSLLLWQRPAPATPVTLGALTIEAAEAPDALWVVDGQQRLTSLANVLHEDGAQDPRFRVAYDLRTQRVASPHPTRTEPWIIPLPTLFSLNKFLRWFNDNPEAADYLDFASEVAEAVRQYVIPANVVKSEDVSVLQVIFDRMNNYGKRLKRAEVFTALNAVDEDSTTGLTIGRIRDQLDDEEGFGQLDDNTVLQAILVRRGSDVGRDIRLEFTPQDRRSALDFPGEDRDAAFEGGREALVAAIRFLRDEAGVPHTGFLAYRYLLVVLTRFFALHPHPKHRNRQLLRRWYWRSASVGSAIGRGSPSFAIRVLGSRITSDDESGSVQRLLTEVRPFRAQAQPHGLTTFRTNNAETKILLCALWALNPRSLNTGIPYDQSHLSTFLNSSSTAAEAVPTVLDRLLLDEEHRRWAANRLLLPDDEAPVGELASRLTTRPPLLAPSIWNAVLASHAISREAREALASGQPVDFLTARTRSLREALTAFLHRWCEWDMEDTPPLEDLVIEDLGTERGAD
ncbi:DUF262 domain-containing protein [Actinoalloteichus spitiensis]|uniref:DUF262 domain-containing protein n=1 Tax=Actinoalloteichus spitiensis TaxID=252394 RepID=UPI00037835BD|nr:DUF262 domain-containing protein [Actinoalloteichus spitiensis]